MAQLIKFTTEPHKYFAQRKEQFWPLNLIISEETYAIKKNFPEKNLVFKNDVSKIIGEYLDKSSKDNAKAKTRGSIIKRQHTVADILTLALIWRRNVEHEIKAMITLSKSIAEIILNTETYANNNLELHNYLQNRLRNFFYINIYLPLHVQENLPVFESLEYFRHEKEAQLKIFIDQEEHLIDLTGLNIRRVISRAIKNMAAQTC